MRTGPAEKAALGHKVLLQPPSVLELNLSPESSDGAGSDCKDFLASSVAQEQHRQLPRGVMQEINIVIAGTEALLIFSAASTPLLLHLVFFSFLKKKRKKKFLGATGCQEASVAYGGTFHDSPPT